MDKLYTLAAVTGMLLAAQGALGQPMCPGDLSGDEEVTVDEILTSVNSALNGCPVRFVDNGDGTISDNWTGLMWEKKSDDGSIHDKDNLYAFSPCDVSFETPLWLFLSRLKTPPCFAGYCDWRMPNVSELESIVDRSTYWPAVDPVFHDNCVEGCTVTTCSCTHVGPGSHFYWSWVISQDPSCTVGERELECVWGVDFDNGSVQSVRTCQPWRGDFLSPSA